MFNFDPNDPRKYGLMQMALALMGSKGGNLAQNFGNAGLMGMHGYQTQRAMNAREKEEQQQAAQRQFMMEQQQKQVAEQDQIRQLAGRAFAQPQVSPNDPYEAHQMPGGGGMPEFAKGLMGINPLQAIGLLQKQGPMKMGKDDRLVDPVTYKELVGAAPGDQWVDIGRDEKTGQHMQRNKTTNQLRAAGTMPQQVNVSTNLPPLERKEQQDMGALHVKNYGDMQTAAGVARKENSLLSALAKNPVQTGAATPLTATAAAWLSAAGLGGDQVKQLASDAQQFNAVAKDLVLQKQLAQKGPQTESDARRLEQTVANLGNTPESNAAIIAFSMAQNNRAIQQERFYNAWWQKKGTLRGADEEWISGPGSKSLWDDPSLAKFAPSASEGKAPSIEDIDAEIQRRLKGRK